MKYSLCLSGFLATVVAISTQTYTAVFESESGGGIVEANLTGPYDGLLYRGFPNAPFDEQAGDCAYVCAQSFPVAVGFTANPGAVANISADYVNSTVKYFTLSDFYFGCNGYYTNVTDPSTGRPLTYAYESPVNCTLNVQAFTSPTKAAVAKQTLQYRPQLRSNRNTGAPAADMTHVTLSSAFQAKGIRFIKFTASGPASGYTLGANNQMVGPYAQSVPQVLFDNVSYTVYSS